MVARIAVSEGGSTITPNAKGRRKTDLLAVRSRQLLEVAVRVLDGPAAGRAPGRGEAGPRHGREPAHRGKGRRPRARPARGTQDSRRRRRRDRAPGGTPGPQRDEEGARG